jgi:hypothetical protein
MRAREALLAAVVLMGLHCAGTAEARSLTVTPTPHDGATP